MPDVYLELIVDSDGVAKRTTVKKKTSSPQWDESFTIYVSESSVLEFKAICKAKVFDDTMLGSKTIKLSHWLKKESDNGKCEISYFHHKNLKIFKSTTLRLPFNLLGKITVKLVK